jgi:short-subunit dehydrogenase
MHIREKIGSSKRALRAALTGGGSIVGWPLRHQLLGSRTLAAVVAGRTVMVTGASSGIGHAIALRLAHTGCKVVLVARSIDKLLALEAQIARGGGEARSYAADLSSGPSTGGLLARLAADGIQPDVLINNAGRSIRRSIDDSRERLHDYERTMALNYFGAIRLILGLLPGMRSRERGHIINVSSSGTQMGTPMFSAYIASKAALDAFSRVASAETRHDGIRFTTVHMPLVRTPMIAPTPAFRDAPALSPEQAADLVLRALITHEQRLGTRMAQFFALAHMVAPAVVERTLSIGYRLLADTQEISKADCAPLRRVS